MTTRIADALDALADTVAAACRDAAHGAGCRLRPVVLGRRSGQQAAGRLPRRGRLARRPHVRRSAGRGIDRRYRRRPSPASPRPTRRQRGSVRDSLALYSDCVIDARDDGSVPAQAGTAAAALRAANSPPTSARRAGRDALQELIAVDTATYAARAAAQVALSDRDGASGPRPARRSTAARATD